MPHYFFLLNSLHLQKKLTYRLRLFLWFFGDMLNFLIFPFIWLSIYADQETIRGFTRADIVTYFVISLFIDLMTISHMSRFVRTDIRHGKLNSFLIKPQNYPLSLLANELSYKIIALTFCFILFPIISYLAPTYVSFPSSSIIIPFVLCIIISYGISFTIQLIIGFSAFYLGNSTALIQLRYILELVFSGELAPLTFFPKPLQIIAAWLPFQYRIFIPAQIFLGNITGITIWQHIGIALLWLAGLLLISFFLWRAGLKRYAGYGG